MKTAHSQRGVALITAVLIVALATIVAVNVAFQGYLNQRRAATTYSLEQAFEVAKGAEAWAANSLKEDAASNAKQDHLAERWATPIPPLPIDGGEITGQLIDLQGRFNLNTLVQFDSTSGQPATNQPAYEQLERLLELLEIEPHWAAKITDWIDPDDRPVNSDGAEDNIYMSQTPPYRTPNLPLTRVSELLALPEFGLERYRKLAPHVTALPATNYKINLCTATGYVLDSMLGGQSNYSRSPQSLIEGRKNGCFPQLTGFKSEMASGSYPPNTKKYFEDHIGEQSTYFEATVWITIGTTRFTLYSVLMRHANQQVGIYLRSFGSR